MSQGYFLSDIKLHVSKRTVISSQCQNFRYFKFTIEVALVAGSIRFEKECQIDC